MALNKSRSARFALLQVCALTIVTTGFITTAHAQSSEETVKFDLPAQSLEQALKSFSVSADKQLMFATDLAEGKTVAGLSGEMGPMQALDELLDGTGLVYETTSSNVILVKVADADQRGASDSKNLTLAPALMAQTQPTEQAARSFQQSDSQSRNDESRVEDAPLEEIIVTGTNIRGATPTSSPVISFDRSKLSASGFNTVGEFMESVPQNFSGLGGDTQGLPGDTAAGNNGAASVVNLRGLGPDSTLVLVNGRRLAPAGSRGAFVDVSVIPLSAVERIEILTDGASAVYGSDAVGGVVNYILRDDYDGAETSVRYGNISNSDADEITVSQVIGHNWDDGNALVSYEFGSQGPLNAADRDFATIGDEFDLTPDVERHSVFAALRQEVSPTLSFSAEGIYSKRDVTRDTISGTVLTADQDTEQFSVAIAAEKQLRGEWAAEVAGSYGENTTRSENTFGFQEGSASLLTVDVTADGPIVNLPGGALRGAFGGQYRREEGAFTAMGFARPDTDNNRDVFAAFAELNVPIFSSSNTIPGFHELEITVATRYEDYSDVGDSFDPKVGIAWSPVPGFRIRGTASTSFKAPLFSELDGGQFAFLLVANDPADTVDGRTVTLVLTGANPDLKPEQSTAFTAGFDFAPESAPGLQVNGTYFNIEYEDRIGLPGISTVNPLAQPEVFGSFFDRSPDPAFVQSFAPGLFDLSVFPSFGPASMLSDVEVVVNARDTNIAQTDVSGFDFNASYEGETEYFGYNLGLSGTYYIDFENTPTPSSETIETLNTLFNPVDLRLRARAGIRKDGLSANFAVNHLAGYQDDTPATPIPIDSWTTVDAQIRYDFGDRPDVCPLRDLSLSLSATNLFNEDPPFVDPASLLNDQGFDPANANPRGRVVSVQLIKQW